MNTGRGARNAIAVVVLSGLLIPAAGTASTARPIRGPLHTWRNAIYDVEGHAVRLRGLAREYLNASPVLDGESLLTDRDIAALRDKWNANIVRVFLGQQFWNANECKHKASYPSIVDRVVRSITSRGMVALLDLHWNTRLPCLPAHQQRMADDPGSIRFWSSVAARYKRNPLVAFQLYNEPRDISWDVWRDGGVLIDGTVAWKAAGMQELYDAVRSSGATNLIFVSGNNYGNAPPPTTRLVDGYNIVYAAQYYTCTQPPPRCTTPNPYDPAPSAGRRIDAWASMARTSPVMITEFGWPDPNSGVYNANVIRWAEAHGVGWIAYQWGVPQTGGSQPLLASLPGSLQPKPASVPWGVLADYGPHYPANAAGAPVKQGLATNR